MCSLSRLFTALGLLSVVSGTLGADAHASPGRLWIGSSGSGVWESSAAGLPIQGLRALAEDGFGISVEFEKTTGIGPGSDHVQNIPLARLGSFLAHNQPTGVLVASYADPSSAMVVYAPDPDVWGALSPPDALERFSLVLAASSVLLADADPLEAEGLAPFACAAAEGGDATDVYLLADGSGQPAGARSPLTLEVISTAPPQLRGDPRLPLEGYDLLELGEFEGRYLASTPEYGVLTPDGLFDVWVHPAFTDAELSASRDVLLDAVKLWETEPMAPEGRTSEVAMLRIADQVYAYITEKLQEEFYRANSTAPDSGEVVVAAACLDLVDAVYEACGGGLAVAYVDDHVGGVDGAFCEDGVDLIGRYLDRLDGDLLRSDDFLCSRFE